MRSLVVPRQSFLVLIATLHTACGMTDPLAHDVAQSSPAAMANQNHEEEPTASARAALSVVVARLTASDPELRDSFGGAVSVSSNVAVVAAQNKTVAGLPGAGAVYVFEYSVPMGWTQTAKLTAPTPTSGEQFGQWSVSTDGRSILVSTAKKAVHVFVKQGSAWIHEGVLQATDTAPDAFGYSSCIVGDIAVVGAHVNEPGVGPFIVGSAYVFTRRDGLWTQRQKLMASDGILSDFFGISVAMEGTTLVVGAARAHASRSVSNAGAAYVYSWVGGIFTEQAKLVPDDPRGDSVFGVSVGISGSRIIAAAPRAKLDDGRRIDSAAYIFRRAGTTWYQEQKLIPTIDRGDAARSDLYSVAIAGETAVLKKYSTIKTYSVSTGSWTFQESFRSPVGIRDSFNPKVALSGGTLLLNSAPVLVYSL